MKKFSLRKVSRNKLPTKDFRIINPRKNYSPEYFIRKKKIINQKKDRKNPKKNHGKKPRKNHGKNVEKKPPEKILKTNPE